jgi:hypothetical protein
VRIVLIGLEKAVPKWIFAFITGTPFFSYENGIGMKSYRIETVLIAALF